jgi:hypothetical protein
MKHKLIQSSQLEDRKMKAKIAGMMVLLAGTATVFAATHSSLNETVKPGITGVADLVQDMNNRLNMEMEFVGLEPNTLYVARMENSSCENISGQASTQPNGLYVATYIESNQFGSYSSVFNGLPARAQEAQSVVLYSAEDDSQDGKFTTVHCQNIG